MIYFLVIACASAQQPKEDESAEPTESADTTDAVEAESLEEKLDRVLASQQALTGVVAKAHPEYAAELEAEKAEDEEAEAVEPEGDGEPMDDLGAKEAVESAEE